MEKYQPPYTITNQMLSYVASISEKIGRITLISTGALHRTSYRMVKYRRFD